MLPLIISTAVNVAMSKQKVTKETTVAGILAAVTFLFFAFSLGYSVLTLKEILVTNGFTELFANMMMSLGAFFLAMISALLTRRSYKKMKANRESNIDKLSNLADAFLAGFNNPDETKKEAAEN